MTVKYLILLTSDYFHLICVAIIIRFCFIPQVSLCYFLQLVIIIITVIFRLYFSNIFILKKLIPTIELSSNSFIFTTVVIAHPLNQLILVNLWLLYSLNLKKQVQFFASGRSICSFWAVVCIFLCQLLIFMLFIINFVTKLLLAICLF